MRSNSRYCQSPISPIYFSDEHGRRANVRKAQSQNSAPTAFSLSSRNISGNISNFVSQILLSKFVCRGVLLLLSLSIGRKQRVPFIVYVDFEGIDVPSNPFTTVGSNTKKLKSSFFVVLVLISSTREVSLSVLSFSASKIFVLQNRF